MRCNVSVTVARRASPTVRNDAERWRWRSQQRLHQPVSNTTATPANASITHRLRSKPDPSSAVTRSRDGDLLAVDPPRVLQMICGPSIDRRYDGIRASNLSRIGAADEGRARLDVQFRRQEMRTLALTRRRGEGRSKPPDRIATMG